MARAIDDKTILEKFAADFVRVVEKRAKYAVVSGFVAIAHGRSRGTEDIDMIVERLPKDKFVMLHSDLTKAGFECLQSEDAGEIYDEYLARNSSVRYVRKGGHVPEMEFKLSRDALDEYQLETRKKLPFTGIDMYFSSVEMNIAFKEELLKSEKDMDDAKHLRIVYRGRTDEKEIEKIKSMIRKLRLSRAR